MTLVVNLPMMLKHAALGAAFFCLALVSGCSGEIPIERLSGQTMGTTWSVVIANPIGSHDGAQLTAELEAALAEVNRQMSTYDPESEISRFNADDRVGEWFPVSGPFADMTARALGFSEVSAGAFDPTSARLSTYGVLGPRRRRRICRRIQTLRRRARRLVLRPLLCVHRKLMAEPPS